MEAMNISPANIGSHNARATQIRKFVANPPNRATTLRLVTAEEPPQTLGEWDVTQARGNHSLSLEVSALLEEHTATVQRPTEAVLGWMVGETKIVASKRLRARYTPPPDEADDGGDQLAFEALGINGTTTGQVIQMQRHIEARERTSNTFVHGLMNTALQLNGQLQAQLQDAYTRIHELQQQQIDAAAATVAEYVETAEPAPIEVDSATEARTQAVQVVTQLAMTYGPTLIQAAMARLVSPQSAIQLPPVPPAAAPPAPSSPTPPAAPTAPAAAAVSAAVPPAPAAPLPPSPSAGKRAQRASIRPAPKAAPPRRK